jgi:hypothetical protein
MSTISRGIALGVCVLAACGFAACAETGWPDERGVAVPLSYAENVRAADAFLEALTAGRAGTTLAAPTVTPYFQQQIRQIAEALQRGELSASRAREEALRWGQAVYHRSVDAWVLDCRAGSEMSLPGGLVGPPVVAIAYAASHFRPRSASAVQCAIVVVSARGAEHVGLDPLGASR